jgi:hypothetical protein
MDVLCFICANFDRLPFKLFDYITSKSSIRTRILGMREYGMVWYGMVWYGMVWYGMVWYGMVWYGMAWHGMVWYANIFMYLRTN